MSVISSKWPPELASSLSPAAFSPALAGGGLGFFLAWRDAAEDAMPRVCDACARSAAAAEGGARSAPGPTAIPPNPNPPTGPPISADDPRRRAVNVPKVAPRSAARVGAGADDAAAAADATRRRR